MKKTKMPMLTIMLMLFTALGLKAQVHYDYAIVHYDLKKSIYRIGDSEISEAPGNPLKTLKEATSQKQLPLL